MGAALSATMFDFSPGAEVPVAGGAGGTAPTQALASAAYRDSPVDELTAANPDAKFSGARYSLLVPNLGEAFSRAVQKRLLAPGRPEMVQAFGIDPKSVVDHCMAASRIRRERDSRLTAVMLACAVLFLPGTLVWLGAFQLRRILAAKRTGPGAGVVGGVVLFVVAMFAALFLLVPPFTGFWSLYFRLVLVAPVAGWLLAKQICERTARVLRERWSGVLAGSGAATVPEAVPSKPNDHKAEQLRKEYVRLGAEQNSNVLFYAGRKGILGMGPRWGVWQMAETLEPRPGTGSIDPFRSWDVARAIQDRLTQLDRGPLHTGGFPKPDVRHWVVVPVGEGADKIERPTGSETEAYSVKPFEVQRICNEQHFDNGPRHYLGVQFVLYDGKLVNNLLVNISVLYNTLRVEISAYSLGPVSGKLTGGPSAKTKSVDKAFKPWEKRTVQLPLVDMDEVVRLSVRAPFTWFPHILDEIGGKLALPEPFGLRHAWTETPWNHRFMADDALRAVTPVLRAVHAATVEVLHEHGVNTDKFALGGAPDAKPGKTDDYGL
ncbi:hypothetical protein ACFV1B_26045 [Streptomyces sp. NPDC059637]|uniref:hypothetical protein n=1 Tax=Streptomyces TaxID=1883 RepID=UPI00367A18C7